MFIAILLAVTTTVSGTLSGTGPDTAAPPPPAATAAADKQRYCVEGIITGSIIPRRECHTRAEWLQQGFDPLNPKNTK